jgi:hypothetical protein
VTAKSSIHKRSMLYKSGVYALRVAFLTPGGLPYALSIACDRTGLREEESFLPVGQKSAEGIVGRGNP